MKIEDIKYRAWNGKHLLYSKDFSSLDMFFLMTNAKGVEYSQYIHVKDSEGKEVYSNDIIEYHSNYGIYRIMELSEIQKYREEFLDDRNYKEALSLFKILGNIYQNPELLSKLS